MYNHLESTTTQTIDSPLKNRLLQLPVELHERIFILAQNPALVTVCKNFWELGQSVTVRAHYLFYRYGSAVFSKRAMKRKIVRLDVIEQLLRYHVPKDDWLFTFACESHQVQLAQWILSSTEKETCIHYAHLAVMKGDTHILDLVASKVDIRPFYGLLLVAQEEDRLDMIQHLMTQYGFDIHYGEERLLRNASHQGQLAIVKFILSMGGNVHAVGDAAIQSAAYKGFPKVVKLLLNAGANAQVNNNLCIKAAFVNRDMESIQALVKAGVDVRWNHDWLLEQGCRYGYDTLVQIWLDAVDDVNLEDGRALQLCLKYGSINVLQTLLENDADPNQPGVLHLLKRMGLKDRRMDLMFQAGLRLKS